MGTLLLLVTPYLPKKHDHNQFLHRNVPVGDAYNTHWTSFVARSNHMFHQIGYIVLLGVSR